MHRTLLAATLLLLASSTLAGCKDKKSEKDEARPIETTAMVTDTAQAVTPATSAADEYDEDLDLPDEDAGDPEINALLDQVEALADFMDETVSKAINGNCSMERYALLQEKADKIGPVDDRLKELKSKMTDQQRERYMNLEENIQGAANRLSRYQGGY